MAQLFIGQLPFSKFFPDDLLNLFRPYGTVVSHQLHIRQGNAFVTYVTADEADAAIRALHGQCALGTRSQPIQVMYSKGTRLISPFGLQHRSLCLSLNKDRQKTKDVTVGSTISNANNNSTHVIGGVPCSASKTTSESSAAEETFNALSPGGVSSASATAFTPLLYSVGFEDVLAGNTARANSVGVASFASRGVSDISFEDVCRPRQEGVGHTIWGSTALSLPPPPSPPQQQQQLQQSFLTGIPGLESLNYGQMMPWMGSAAAGMQHSSATAATMTTTTTANNSIWLSSPSGISSSGAATVPPLSYVLLPSPPQTVSGAPSGFPPGVPVYFVMPASTASTYLVGATTTTPQQQQQQQPFLATYTAPSATALLPQQIAYGLQ